MFFDKRVQALFSKALDTTSTFKALRMAKEAMLLPIAPTVHKQSTAVDETAVSQIGKQITSPLSAGTAAGPMSSMSRTSIPSTV